MKVNRRPTAGFSLKELCVVVVSHSDESYDKYVCVCVHAIWPYRSNLEVHSTHHHKFVGIAHARQH